MLIVFAYLAPLVLCAAAVAGTFAIAMGLIMTARILWSLLRGRPASYVFPAASFRQRWCNALRRYW